MDYKMLIKCEDFEKVVTDVLYSDLETENVDFLKMAYEHLGINTERIMKVREKNPKIAGKATYIVYEDIISIIVEEICRKGNKELYHYLMDFYLDRFPETEKRFEDCGNDVKEWKKLCFELSNTISPYDLLEANYMILYIITHGEDEDIKTFLKCYKSAMEFSQDVPFNFYDRKNKTVDCCDWLEKFYQVHNLKTSKMFSTMVKNCKNGLVDYLKESRNEFEVGIEVECEDILLYHMMRKHYLGKHTDAYLIDVIERMNTICKKYYVNRPAFLSRKRPLYLKMIRNIFSEMCMELLFNYCTYTEETGNRVSLEEICSCLTFGSPERVISELTSRFWIECYMMSQNELFDEYYKNFSFEKNGMDKEKIYKENNCLKDELSHCKKKLQQYADADAERRKQQNQDAKKENREYIEKITSLEKQLNEQKKLLEEQARTMEAMDTYIALIESKENKKPEPEEPKETELSKIYQNKILFVGGMQETITRLKAVFSTANFITNETMQPPKKTDFIVLMPEHMNHSLYYKYIRLAREKGIKVTYCSGTNTQAITRQVACCL